MVGPRKIAVVDRHPLYVDALAAMFRDAWPDVRVLALQWPDLAGARDEDILLIDLDTFRESGMTDLAGLVRDCSATPVVALANQAARHQVLSALHAGARAFLPKTMSGRAIRDAVSLVLEGGSCFPAEIFPDVVTAAAEWSALRCKRELDVLRELDRGASNKMIARELGVSVATVKLHVQAILRATQAKNRTEAIANARRMGLLPAH